MINMINEFKKFLPRIRKNVFLKEYTTFKVGGPAKYFLTIKNIQELKIALEFAQRKGLPVFVIGEGSNILVADEGLDGLVLKIEMKGLIWQEKGLDRVELEVMAGENWDKIVEKTVAENLYGLENLSGIPGSAGAAPIQNIGAYGQEIKNVILWVEVLDTQTLKRQRLSAKECEFSYRESIFKKESGKSFIVTKICLSLSRMGQAITEYPDVSNYIIQNNIKKINPKVMRQIILKIRQSKFPNLSEIGTAGSFFKNPIIPVDHFKLLKEKFPQMPYYLVNEKEIKIPTAWILDKVCNLKGFCKKDAGLYEKQPLVLVNYGKAKAKEIYELAQWVKTLVKEKTGIELEEEVRLLGF